MSLSQSSSPSGGWTPPTVEELHALLPQYEIDAILGQGGMGAVYKGRQEALGRTVAIKLLPESLVADDNDHNYVERFKLEARAMANLDHPAIISVHDFGQTDAGHLYFVMEFIDGMDIQEYIKACGGTVDPEHAIAIVSHVLDALDYAHSKGILHRDIKPANVLINSEGRVKIADFGLAKEFSGDDDDDPENAVVGLTMTDMAMGTPDYIAPEALEIGVTPDGRADLYAVGVMLYRMLTGRLPRGMFKLPSEEKPELDPRFDTVVARALEGRPEDRYQKASEFRGKLDELLTQPVSRIDPSQDTAAVSPPARQFQFGEPSGPIQAKEKAEPQIVSRPPKKKAAKPRKSKPAGLLIGVPVAVVLIAGIVFLATRPKDPGPEDGTESASTQAEPATTSTQGRSDTATPGSTETEWPTGPNYASEGRFRAWSSIPNDPAIDLSPLRGIEDVKQIYLHFDGWIVLRENGETISRNGVANRTGIRKICAGAGPQFALITNSGLVEGVNGGGTRRLQHRSGAIDCFYSEPVTAILFEDGSLYVEGKAFDGIDEEGNQEWKEKPELLPGEKAVAISATPYNFVAQLDNGKLKVWTNKDGLIPLPGYLAESKLKSFVINGRMLNGIPINGGKAVRFRVDRSEKSAFPGGNALAIFPATNGFFLIHEDGRISLSENFRDSAPQIFEVIDQIGAVTPNEIYFSLKSDRDSSNARVLWLDGELKSDRLKQDPPDLISTEIESAAVAPSSWPSGPNYASEGRFRAWSSKPNDPVLDLSRLNGIRDVQQVCTFEDGWVVLRKNGETISRDGKADRRGIRKICPSHGPNFSLITSEGQVVLFDRNGEAPADEILDALPPVSDCWIEGPQRVALLEDGSVRIWGDAFAGRSRDVTRRWTQTPVMPTDRKAIAISVDFNGLGVQFEDGELTIWSPDQGLIELPEALADGGIARFQIHGNGIVTIPKKEGGHPFHFSWKTGRSGASFSEAGNSAIALLSAGNALAALTRDGLVDGGTYFDYPGVSAAQAFDLVRCAKPKLFSVYLDSSDRIAHLLWFDDSAIDGKGGIRSPGIAPNSGRVDGLVANGEWQDVLGAIADEHFFSTQEWRSEGGDLIGKGGHSPKTGLALLAVRGIQTERLSEFEVRVRFTPGEGQGGIAFLLPSPAQGMSIFAWPGPQPDRLRIGLQPIKGDNGPGPENSRVVLPSPMELKAGEEHEMWIKVGSSGVEILFNGKSAFSYSPESWTSWDQSFAHGAGKPPIIGLRVEGRSATFHSFEIRIPKPATTGESVESPETTLATNATSVVPDLPELKTRLANFRQARKQEIDSLVKGYLTVLEEKRDQAQATEAGAAKSALTAAESFAASIKTVLDAQEIRPLPKISEKAENLAPEFAHLQEAFARQLDEAEIELQGKLDQSLQFLESKLSNEGKKIELETVRKYRADLKAFLAIPPPIRNVK